MGETYRYSRDERENESVVDGLPNFYWHTQTQGMPKAKLERGIARLPAIKVDSASRVPAILIRSTPWKAGDTGVPWHDTFDETTGVASYFGDNKIDKKTGQPKHADPKDSLGNRHLLQMHMSHIQSDKSVRRAAGPVLLFTGVPVGGRQKGNVRFDGLGVVDASELVEQTLPTGDRFLNFRFDLQLLDLEADNFTLRWDWISGRRSNDGSTTDFQRLAPVAWKRWVESGRGSLHDLRLRRWPVRPLSQ